MEVENIEEKYKPPKRAYTFLTCNRSPFSTWAQCQIKIYTALMDATDFFCLMIQTKFINPTNVTYLICSFQMNLNQNNGKTADH